MESLGTDPLERLDGSRRAFLKDEAAVSLDFLPADSPVAVAWEGKGLEAISSAIVSVMGSISSLMKNDFDTMVRFIVN